MKQEIAETIALQIMGWLAAEDDLLGVFLGASGADLNDMKRRAAEPEFQLAVVDFVLMDDAWVIACCTALGLENAALQQVRQALPGGQETNWT